MSETGSLGLAQFRTGARFAQLFKGSGLRGQELIIDMIS